MINFIQIFGERCSGTNFLTQLVKDNFDGIQITKDFGGKHWFIKDHHPRCRANDSTDLQCIRDLNDHDDTLMICIFRNPYDWVRSLRDRPYHARNHNNLRLSEFIRKPWHSFEHNRVNQYWSDREDSYWFIEEAVNVLRLRSMKIEHLLNLKQNVEQVCYLNYEHLAGNNEVLKEIATRYDVPLRHEGIKGVSKYLGRARGMEFSPKTYAPFSDNDLEYINDQLDWSLENDIGYVKARTIEQVDTATQPERRLFRK